MSLTYLDVCWRTMRSELGHSWIIGVAQIGRYTEQYECQKSMSMSIYWYANSNRSISIYYHLDYVDNKLIRLPIAEHH